MSCRCSGQEHGDVFRGLSHTGRFTKAHHIQGSLAVVSSIFSMLYAFKCLFFLNSVACGRKVSRHLCQGIAEVSVLSSYQEVPDLGRTLR